MRVTAFFACAAILSAATCLHADDVVDPSRTRVQLDAHASAEVDNDSMRATLFAEIEDADAARAADQINRAARETLALLKRYAGLKIRTGGYSTFPLTEKGRIVRWRARTEVILEGQEFARISEAIGRVQNRMQLAGVEFFVSPARRTEIEAELTQAAIADFLAKAGRVAQGFQGSGFHVLEATVSSDGGGVPPRPLMMRSMAAESVAPQFDGGTTRVSIIVSGSVLVTR